MEKRQDLISRQAAIDVVKHAWGKGLEPTQYLEELPPAQPEQRWIPCSERLPEHGGFYIVTRVITEENDKWVGLRWYSTGHGWEWDETPIAWMPLPDPYEVLDKVVEYIESERK